MGLRVVFDRNLKTELKGVGLQQALSPEEGKRQCPEAFQVAEDCSVDDVGSTSYSEGGCACYSSYDETDRTDGNRLKRKNKKIETLP